MFLWRIIENYPSIIIKYPPYLFHCYSLYLKTEEAEDETNEPAHEIIKLFILRKLIL